MHQTSNTEMWFSHHGHLQHWCQRGSGWAPPPYPPPLPWLPGSAESCRRSSWHPALLHDYGSESAIAQTHVHVKKTITRRPFFSSSLTAAGMSNVGWCKILKFKWILYIFFWLESRLTWKTPWASAATAACSGVLPMLSWALGSAPASSSLLAASALA